jgi:hypothetical protein
MGFGLTLLFLTAGTFGSVCAAGDYIAPICDQVARDQTRAEDLISLSLLNLSTTPAAVVSTRGTLG